MKVFQMTFAGGNATTGPVLVGLPSPSDFSPEAGDELTSAIVLVAAGAYSVGDVVTSNFYSPVAQQLGVGNTNLCLLQNGYNMTGVIILGTFQRN